MSAAGLLCQEISSVFFAREVRKVPSSLLENVRNICEISAFQFLHVLYILTLIILVISHLET